LKLHFLVYAPPLSEWSLSHHSLSPFFFSLLHSPKSSSSEACCKIFFPAPQSETVGWITASVLFGFSHITNMHFPNWRYVLLAFIAGLFYGWTWRKTGSIFASAIVHALCGHSLALPVLVSSKIAVRS
jgi:membrane protease YdiL (CAAX protease family)